MRQAMDETSRRRAVQEAYNAEHGITPASIIKNIDDVLSSVYERDYLTVPTAPDERDQFKTRAELDAFLSTLEREMREAAANLEFERAAAVRDRLRRLRNPDLVAPSSLGSASDRGSSSARRQEHREATSGPRRARGRAR